MIQPKKLFCFIQYLSRRKILSAANNITFHMNEDLFRQPLYIPFR